MKDYCLSNNNNFNGETLIKKQSKLSIHTDNKI